MPSMQLPLGTPYCSRKEECFMLWLPCSTRSRCRHLSVRWRTLTMRCMRRRHGQGVAATSSSRQFPAAQCSGACWGTFHRRSHATTSSRWRRHRRKISEEAALAGQPQTVASSSANPSGALGASTSLWYGSSSSERIGGRCSKLPRSRGGQHRSRDCSVTMPCSWLPPIPPRPAARRSSRES